MSALHPDTEFLVDSFCVALKGKLLAAQNKYGYGNGWKADDWKEDCVEALIEHVDKGDPRDVAAYCAFAWHHQWSVKTPEKLDKLRDKNKALEAELKQAQDSLARATKERDVAVNELKNIATADPFEGKYKWIEHFREWAQSRARHALEKIESEKKGGGA